MEAIMDTIELSHHWQLSDDQIGGGGFGSVYRGQGEDGQAVAIKLVPKAPGADRELLIAPEAAGPYVVPILDMGEWKDYFVLVMPLADESLEHNLEQENGAIAWEVAEPILVDVATALAALARKVVHRDIKPGNVLLLDGRWCLSDFGIARYADATTDTQTHKLAKSYPYAAPEQWWDRRATAATDVYAFGIMAFEILEGVLPFPGPTAADFREQHLEQAPPSLSGTPSWLAALITECLVKPPGARPTAERVLARLTEHRETDSPAAARLRDINRSVVERKAGESAAASATASRADIRRGLYETSRESLIRVTAALKSEILADASGANDSPSSRGAGELLHLDLSSGELIVDNPQQAPPDCLAAFDYEAPFDVIAYSAIAVLRPRDRSGYKGRVHSLWFCDPKEEGVFRWYDLAFMVTPSIPQRFSCDPLCPKSNG